MAAFQLSEFPTIETERLVLRALHVTDCHDVLGIFSDERVMVYYGMYPINSLENAVSLIQALQNTFYEGKGIRWAMTLKESGRLIGTCGFHNLNQQQRRAEMGYELAWEYWGLGYAKEAIQAMRIYGVEMMNLHRMEALVYPENLASQGVLERLGFQKEGILRGYAYFRDRYQDLIVYSWLDETHLRIE